MAAAAMSNRDPMEICRQLERTCAPAGFDLLQPLCVGWYNRAVDAEYRVPDLGDPGSLAVVIGNTRALWTPFRRAVAADPALQVASHPLQQYIARVIGAAVEALKTAHEVRFDFEPPPRRVAMQDLAHVAGLAFKSPTYLSVHPTYGPWIALRALVVVATPGPPGPPPVSSQPCVCQHQCAPRLEEAFTRAADARSTISTGDVAEQWRNWLAVRDACPVGREHRYCDAQIRYHYTKERHWLRMPVDRE